MITLNDIVVASLGSFIFSVPIFQLALWSVS